MINRWKLIQCKTLIFLHFLTNCSKTQPGEDVEANKKELLEKVRNIVTHLVSQDTIHKMPIEIK